MSKNKKILLMLLKGGMPQADIAFALHVSKRDVSAASKAIRQHNLAYDVVASMDAAVIDEAFFPKEDRQENEAYLHVDMQPLIERKKKNRKLPVKLFWLEYCERAASLGKLAYSYQTFAQAFTEQAKQSGATQHFIHEPGAKCYIDWVGDVAYITDKITGAKIKVYVLVVTLPFSNKFWAEGFCDMKQKSWQLGQIHAFEYFGGVPRIWVPDNAATATDRSAVSVTLINKEYERFAEHYGAAIVPARIRKPRDKSVAESTVNLVEQWIIGPANELTFYTLEEFNEFCQKKCTWLNSRPFAAKDGSRDEVFEAEEYQCLLPLPPNRYEMCEWRSAKVSPDYHITLDYMHYSVPFTLIEKQVDIKLTSKNVVILYGGEVIASHQRLYGRKGQYSTIVEHMPPNHAALNNPWSAERFISWAGHIGPQTKCAIEHVLASRVIVEQAFVACRNILGLSKTYSPVLLERACAKVNATSACPSYTSLKNAILAIRATDAKACAQGFGTDSQHQPKEVIDRAQSAGRLRGADAYKRSE